MSPAAQKAPDERPIDRLDIQADMSPDRPMTLKLHVDGVVIHTAYRRHLQNDLDEDVAALHDVYRALWRSRVPVPARWRLPIRTQAELAERLTWSVPALALVPR